MLDALGLKLSLNIKRHSMISLIINYIHIRNLTHNVPATLLPLWPFFFGTKDWRGGQQNALIPLHFIVWGGKKSSTQVVGANFPLSKPNCNHNYSPYITKHLGLHGWEALWFLAVFRRVQPPQEKVSVWISMYVGNYWCCKRSLYMQVPARPISEDRCWDFASNGTHSPSLVLF